MISLIICSRELNIPNALKDNIAKTIGIEYELIIIDNSENKYSIFEAYNLGISRAKYPYLCFMHEDILYHTQYWGERVIAHFENKDVGLIGVVGGHFLPHVATWAFTSVDSGVIMQGDRSTFNTDNYSGQNLIHDKYRKDGENSIQVVAVDGLWLCFPKSIFEKISFDNDTYNGFHAYDLDISMQVNIAGYSVCAIFDIVIEHFSWGGFDSNYALSIDKFHKKWSSYLPILKGIEMTEAEQSFRTEFALNNFENRLQIDRLKKELSQIRNSKAYHIGKFILKPIVWINLIFKYLLQVNR